jgi:type I restriction enzyme, S subunit
VKAKAAGATAFPGMPPEAFAALPNTLQDSPLGPVPQGWEVGWLGDNADINKSSVKAGQIDGEIEYVDIASVSVGQLAGVQVTAFRDAPGRARRRVRHGDSIWSCVRPNRRSYLFVHSPPVNRIVSTGFAVLSPKVLKAAYIYEATTRQEFVDYFVANADGSAYPAVRADHFANAEVLVPTQVVRDAFEQVAMPLRDMIAAADRESAKLATLRDYLLPRLLSGKARVRL